jgi:hypothetical protein
VDAIERVKKSPSFVVGTFAIAIVLGTITFVSQTVISQKDATIQRLDEANKAQAEEIDQRLRQIGELKTQVAQVQAAQLGTTPIVVASQVANAGQATPVILSPTWVSKNELVPLFDGRVLVKLTAAYDALQWADFDASIGAAKPVTWEFMNAGARQTFQVGADTYYFDVLEIASDRAYIEVLRGL